MRPRGTGLCSTARASKTLPGKVPCGRQECHGEAMGGARARRGGRPQGTGAGRSPLGRPQTCGRNSDEISTRRARCRFRLTSSHPASVPALLCAHSFDSMATCGGEEARGSQRPLARPELADGREDDCVAEWPEPRIVRGSEAAAAGRGALGNQRQAGIPTSPQPRTPARDDSCAGGPEEIGSALTSEDGSQRHFLRVLD